MKKHSYIIRVSVLIIIFVGGFIIGRTTTNARVEEIPKVTSTPAPIVKVVTPTPKPPKKISLGICKLTAYCCENYPHICNNGDATYTATMTTPIPGRTIAVDPSVIPYGTQVEIEGIGVRIAEDCGGAVKGNKIDILFATHEEALNFGVQYAEVSYIVKGEK